LHLVGALDRRVAASPELKTNEPAQSALNQLFKLAQSVPDFDPEQFADALQKFSAAPPPRHEKKPLHFALLPSTIPVSTYENPGH
jgi:hypothetical protein